MITLFDCDIRPAVFLEPATRMLATSADLKKLAAGRRDGATVEDTGRNGDTLPRAMEKAAA